MKHHPRHASPTEELSNQFNPYRRCHSEKRSINLKPSSGKETSNGWETLPLRLHRPPATGCESIIGEDGLNPSNRLVPQATNRKSEKNEGVSSCQRWYTRWTWPSGTPYSSSVQCSIIRVWCHLYLSFSCVSVSGFETSLPPQTQARLPHYWQNETEVVFLGFVACFLVQDDKNLLF